MSGKMDNIKSVDWREKTSLFFSRMFFVLWSLIDAIIPNKSNLLIFSGGNGKFAGNSAFLFEHALKQSQYDSYFLVHTSVLYSELNSRFPGRIINSYTFTGFWTFLRSRVIFLTHGKGDVRPWPLNPSQKLIVNLWHGTHLKQVSVPMKEYSALIVSSQFEKKISYQAFGSSSSNYWLTGTPRTDILLKQAKSAPDDKIILYAPTWREEQIQDEEGKKGAKIFPLKNFNINELVDLLDKYDAKLLFRWHNNDLIDEKSQELYDCTKISDRLILAGPEQYPDVQKLLLKSSILITDYSTLMHDFLLLDRPIIFFPYDYETYIRERGFYYDYNLFTPGPKIDSHSDFIKTLEKFLLNPQAGSKWRQLVSDIMFPQKDGMSSERIMNKVSDIIFQEK